MLLQKSGCGTRLTRIAAIISVILIFQGCAISKKDCLSDDWQTIGYRDGKSGKSPSSITAYTKRCSKFDVVPDAKIYQQGFDVGIVEFCTAENGYSVGERNQDYSGACPSNLEPVFLRSYIDGLRLKMEDLAITYDRDSIRLDALRDHRDRLRASGASTTRDEKRISSLRDSLESNAGDRRKIRNKISKWRSRI